MRRFRENDMKKIFKGSICIALCIITAISLFSCKGDGQEQTEDTSAEEVFALTTENISEYRIIVSDDLSEELSGAIKSLQEYIKTIIGVQLEVKSDLVVANSDKYYESEYEILVGETNRASVKDVYRDIRTEDHGYAMADKKVLIFGNTSSIAQLSADVFKRDVLDKAKNGESTLLYSGESKITAGQYTYDALTVNGVDIKDYSIVYPAGAKLGERDIAMRFAKWIEVNTGYTVECVPDSGERQDNEIQIGNTNRITADRISRMNSALISDGQYYISCEDDILWATGKDQSAILGAVTGMLDRINGDGKLEFLESICADKKEAAISVMSYNIRGMMDADKRNSEDVIVSIKQREPDIFAPQEATTNSAEWISRLDAALGNEYQSFKGLRIGNYLQYQPVYFKKDRFELISSASRYLTHTPDKKSRLEGAEYDRIVTFVVLRDKQTGAQFLYSNNHFDTAGYIVRTEEAKILAEMLEEYPLLPLIVGGDFNTEASTSPIQTLLSKTRLELGESIAEEKILGGSGSSDYLTRGDSIIDIVLVSKESISIRKYEIWDNKTNGRYPSDHLPVWVELTVKY